ncbi:TonB-dependent receptor plug domain-containing protein [Mucilaginibacter sp. Bleaf8]|uniref:TonB-dependent receptor plug domain-containing protein n=1 Tax=Mucilaginibacter sp. Bleaf8 TaxID=2834430 RepID=UPI001BCE72A1|nr:TonB-dependent receptor plug domain-containing protein [Mucilaginibacter sp. Bleaf8]MBS7566086.1 TonB-dependent receptor plug domain-containing protein [Mucilaginibacter sp. Bleaf8]
MNFRKTLLYTCTIGLVLGLAGFVWVADDPVITRITSVLEKWTNDNPQEKVYLQLDKPYYAVGDDIWFKAYITVGTEHKLSALSGSLNVELIDDRDSVKQYVKLPVTSGIAWGDFALSDTLREGTYRIRAYTNWMRNAGEDYFFNKTIAIGNAATNTVFTQTRFTYSTVNNEQKVTALITYNSLNGTPYTGKEVSYKVQLNDRQITRGRGITDNQGNIRVEFENTNPALLTLGRIITDIKVADKKTINKTIPVTATSNRVSVQFFPESGYLVNGIRSKVAFKAVGADGLGVDIKGTVTDNDNQQVATISTRHLGMGYFALAPQAGKTYTAQLTYPDGSQSTVSLPQVQAQGYVMSINQTDSANISIRVTGSANQTGSNQVYVVAQSGGAVKFVAKNNNGSNTFGTLIPKSRFPSGITQFTLFSANGEPLNERLVFIQNRADQLNLNVSAAQSASGVREKVKINLNATNNASKPVVGLFSAAVIDESKIKTDEATETSILSSILLTSELKGFIEQPNYYFSQVNETTQTDLDVLLLTQGYRRFEWKPLLASNFPVPVYQPEKSLQIAGTIKTSGGKPVPNAKITLFTTAGGTFILDTVADTQGRFAFNNLIFKDSIRFVLQARTAKNGKNVEIILDRSTGPAAITKSRNITTIDANTDSRLTAYLKHNKELYDTQTRFGLGNHTIVLKEVTITEKKKAALENSSNLNGPGNADQIIMGDLFTQMGCTTIDQCLQGRLVGVVFRNGIPYSTRSFNQPMQIIVDGVYIEPDYLFSLNTFDIASIEILRSGAHTAIYGGRGGGGVMIINTKRGGSYTYNAAQIYAPGVITYTPKGYYKAREFYSPQYDDPKTNKAIADLRTTIFWQPNIVTNESGQASFEYYNAGSPGTYRVVVEGIDADGNLGRRVYRYTVR